MEMSADLLIAEVIERALSDQLGAEFIDEIAEVSTDSAVESFVRQLRPYSWVDKVQALAGVGRHPPAQEIMCGMASLGTTDEDPQLSDIVSISLQSIPDLQAPEARLIVLAATRSSSLAVVNGALRALGKLPGDDSAITLQSFLSHSSPGLRAAATASLTDVQPERLRNWIPKLATDDDANVRGSVLRAAHILKERDWLARRAVVDEDMEVRFAAQKYLESLDATEKSRKHSK